LEAEAGDHEFEAIYGDSVSKKKKKILLSYSKN
jgi:hypothetical protein